MQAARLPKNRRQKNLGKAVRKATLTANEFPSEISKLGQIPARLGVFSYRNTAHRPTETLLPSPFSPASGPVTGSFNGLHRECNFLAMNPRLIETTRLFVGSAGVPLASSFPSGQARLRVRMV
jgi:hypothetical protein